MRALNWDFLFFQTRVSVPPWEVEPRQGRLQRRVLLRRDAVRADRPRTQVPDCGRDHRGRRGRLRIQAVQAVRDRGRQEQRGLYSGGLKTCLSRAASDSEWSGFFEIFFKKKQCRNFAKSPVG